MWERGAVGRVVAGLGLLCMACSVEVRYEGGVRDSGGPGAVDAARELPSAESLCGNGRVDVGEACDGNDLHGATCQSVTMGVRSYGTLACSKSCAGFITTGCEIGDPLPGFAGAGGSVGGRTGASGAASGRGGVGGLDSDGGDAGGSAGASYGDPHLFTADGVEYDFQAVGEFVLLEDRDDPSFVVQVRQEPFRPFSTLSANTAVAALVGGDRVEIHAGETPSASVDGVPRSVEGTLSLPHGGKVSEKGEIYTVTWPTGERLLVNATFAALVNVKYVPEAGRKTHRHLRGLIGTPDGNPTNDFVTRQGKVLAARPDGDSLYDVFGNSWRITPGEALFDYAPGEDTRTFSDLEFPHGSRASAALPPQQLKTAYLTCVLAGVTDVAALEACTADVAITGDAGFARAAATPRQTDAR
jgi:hypothetical protein